MSECYQFKGESLWNVNVSLLVISSKDISQI